MATNKEGVIIDASAFPETDDIVAIDLMFADSVEAHERREHTTKRFSISKANAKLLADGLAVIVAAPDAQTARETIAASIAEDELTAEEWAALADEGEVELGIDQHRD